MRKTLFRHTPGRMIALSFAAAIFLGSLLLMLPCCRREGVTVRYIDALYTATSAICVTGLNVMDPGDTFSPLGQFFLGLMIQSGGLGFTLVGAGIMLATGQRISIRGRNLIREASNLDSGKGIVRFVRTVFFTTAAFELTGALLSLPVFIRQYPLPKAIGLSLFHAVSAFNNAGFDILGGGTGLIPYKNNILLSLVTCGLVIAGGLGFPVLRELAEKRFRWKKLSLHSRAVLSTTAVLLAAGTLVLKLTEGIPWLGAFFASVTARTAGFSTYAMRGFTNAGLLMMLLLMVIGASPGSTGGGIKTTTFFTLVQGLRSAATNRAEKAFHYGLPAEAFKKAAVILLLALTVILTGTCIMAVLEPALPLRDVLFEVTSAFGTAGLSTGITPGLSDGSRILTILLMYIGRLGPLTVATLWYFTNGDRVEYAEGNLTIG